LLVAVETLRWRAIWPTAALMPPLAQGFEMVTIVPISSTLTFKPDPTGCPEGFVGTFGFEARL
jgi:hypothetical protein